MEMKRMIPRKMSRYLSTLSSWLVVWLSTYSWKHTHRKEMNNPRLANTKLYSFKHQENEEREGQEEVVAEKKDEDKEMKNGGCGVGAGVEVAALRLLGTSVQHHHH